MTDKLFKTGELNPLSPDYHPEDAVADQGGSASAYVSPAPAAPSSYLAQLMPQGTSASAQPSQPRYTEEKSVRIKREYPLDEFASVHLGGSPKRRGHVMLYPCPAHGESLSSRSPHLEVYLPGHKKHGSCKCYRCGFGGTVIDLAMQIFATDKAGEAMNRIENKTPFDQAKREAYAERARHYAAIEAQRPVLNPVAHVHRMADWAADNLANDELTKAYLASRGLAEVAEYMLLGSTLQMPDHLLPQSWDGEKGHVYPFTGFRGAKDLHGRWVPRVVIPYVRPDGIIRYVNARAASDEVDKKFKYRKPGDVEPEPYLLDNALLEGDDIVMTEGEFDCLSLITSMRDDPIGFFAVPGLNCFTEADAARLMGRRIFIATDSDEAGDDGREALTDMVAGYASRVYHIRVERGFNDINDMLRARGPEFVRGWFKACVQEAVRPARRFV